jgi:hypothetical protein
MRQRRWKRRSPTGTSRCGSRGRWRRCGGVTLRASDAGDRGLDQARRGGSRLAAQAGHGAHARAAPSAGAGHAQLRGLHSQWSRADRGHPLPEPEPAPPSARADGQELPACGGTGGQRDELARGLLSAPAPVHARRGAGCVPSGDCRVSLDPSRLRQHPRRSVEQSGGGRAFHGWAITRILGGGGVPGRPRRGAGAVAARGAWPGDGGGRLHRLPRDQPDPEQLRLHAGRLGGADPYHGGPVGRT